MKYLERIKKVEVDGEKISLKKNKFGGYRVVHPIKNEDGTFNWFNFLTGGSWGKLISLVLTILLILFVIWAYNQDVSECRHLLECGASCQGYPIDISNLTNGQLYNINITKIVNG